MSKLFDLIKDISLEDLRLSGKQKKKREGNYAKNMPGKKGKGLWMKDAFDLVIAKEGCIYGKEHKVENDKKVEGYVQEKVVKICNECIFLTWDDGYICTV